MKKKILRIRLESLRNEPHFQFITDFWQLVRSLGAETLKIEAFWTHFTELRAEEDKRLEAIRKSLRTQTLIALDATRDEIYSGLKYLIKGFANSAFAAKKEAATKMMIIVDKYADVIHREYRDETATIYNFVQELLTNYAADLTTLGLTADVTELDKANKAFNNEWEERANEAADKNMVIDPEVNMLEIRRKINRAYLDIVEYLEALMLIENSAVFTQFLYDWNARVEKYKQIIARQNADDKKDNLENNNIK